MGCGQIGRAPFFMPARTAGQGVHQAERKTGRKAKDRSLLRQYSSAGSALSEAVLVRGCLCPCDGHALRSS